MLLVALLCVSFSCFTALYWPTVHHIISEDFIAASILYFEDHTVQRIYGRLYRMNELSSPFQFLYYYMHSGVLCNQLSTGTPIYHDRGHYNAQAPTIWWEGSWHVRFSAPSFIYSLHSRKWWGSSPSEAGIISLSITVLLLVLLHPLTFIIPLRSTVLHHHALYLTSKHYIETYFDRAVTHCTAGHRLI